MTDGVEVTAAFWRPDPPDTMVEIDLTFAGVPRVGDEVTWRDAGVTWEGIVETVTWRNLEDVTSYSGPIWIWLKDAKEQR